MQEGFDLGERMYNALKAVLKHYSNAIIIGTDIPDLSKKIIDNAILLLKKNDIVIGPSKDGGYYLLGVKKNYKELFEDIKWSSESIFQSTIKKAEILRLKVAILQHLHDVDNIQSFNEWMNQTPNKSLKRRIIELKSFFEKG